MGKAMKGPDVGSHPSNQTKGNAAGKTKKSGGMKGPQVKGHPNNKG